jgi:carboxyl-terminal processing protease
VVASQSLAGSPVSAAPAQRVPHPAPPIGEAYTVTRQDCQKALTRVDQLVREHFYNASISSTAWPQYLAKHRQEILAARNLKELSEKMNAALKVLKSSHCEFSTTNDEIYYFLNSMFAVFNKKIHSPTMNFTGAITGGVNCQRNQVRYIIDGSPAQVSGIRIGDEILTVGGKPYAGQVNFWGTAGHSVKLSLLRRGRIVQAAIKPTAADNYHEYVAAIAKSVRTFKVPGALLGYVHLWAGGAQSHEAFEAVLAEKLGFVDGLILDLRSGYGGNGYSDLDYFYRTAAAYPAFLSRNKDGKTQLSKDYFDKPVVALIDGGARSGKELLAFSLKRTGRARLVGEKTAGAVVAGSLFTIEKRMSLYLAVLDAEIAGVRLEGHGVAPDYLVPGECSQSGWDRQLAVAESLLCGEVNKGKR